MHDLAKIQSGLEACRWTFAKTYAKFAPHEWVAVGKTIAPTFARQAAEAIEDHGVDEEFRVFRHVKTYRYLYLGGYKYWLMDPPESVKIINRVPVKGYPDQAAEG